MLFEGYIVDSGALSPDYRRKCENVEEFAAEKYSRLAACESDASIKLIKPSVWNFSDCEITRETFAILIGSFYIDDNSNA